MKIVTIRSTRRAETERRILRSFSRASASKPKKTDVKGNQACGERQKALNQFVWINLVDLIGIEPMTSSMPSTQL
jgi:hypothetical protein